MTSSLCATILSAGRLAGTLLVHTRQRSQRALHTCSLNRHPREPRESATPAVKAAYKALNEQRDGLARWYVVTWELALAAWHLRPLPTSVQASPTQFDVCERGTAGRPSAAAQSRPRACVRGIPQQPVIADVAGFQHFDPCHLIITSERIWHVRPPPHT